MIFSGRNRAERTLLEMFFNGISRFNTLYTFLGNVNYDKTKL